MIVSQTRLVQQPGPGKNAECGLWLDDLLNFVWQPDFGRSEYIGFQTLLKQLAFVPDACKIYPARYRIALGVALSGTTAKARLAMCVDVALWFSDCLLHPPFDLWLSLAYPIRLQSQLSVYIVKNKQQIAYVSICR